MTDTGRLSRCSVKQDEELAKRMLKTPGTPIKTGGQTPRKSDRKRSLFPSGSPANSDDLGLLSPISSSASSGTESCYSPQFSPNGLFTTPIKSSPMMTIKSTTKSVRNSPRLLKKLEVKSSLFPEVKSYTPKRRGRCSQQLSQEQKVTPSTRQAMLVLEDMMDSEEILQELTTPPRSARRRSRGAGEGMASTPTTRKATVDEEEVVEELTTPPRSTRRPRAEATTPIRSTPRNRTPSTKALQEAPSTPTHKEFDREKILQNLTTPRRSARRGREAVAQSPAQVLQGWTTPTKPGRGDRLASSTKKLIQALKGTPGDDRARILQDLSTPPRSSPRLHGACVVSPSTGGSSNALTSSPEVSKFGIKPLSCESFYGPAPAPPKPRTSLLVIDTLSKTGHDRTRSLSRESSTSRSFVSGSGKHNRTSSGASRGVRSGHQSRSSRRGPIIGVWHGVKKPKKMKKSTRVPKPLVSPNTRLAKVTGMIPAGLKAEGGKRRLFEEKPRTRTAGTKTKKRGADEVEENGIIDSFPYRMHKRQRLPEPDTWSTPDPNKKFVKHTSRTATYTVFDHVKVKFTNGEMRLQSPKRKKQRRHKLYSPSKKHDVDFNDMDQDMGDIGASVENILHTLNKTETIQVEKISDSQLFNILDMPSTRVHMVDATPSKIITQVEASPGREKLLSNLSTLAIQESRDQEQVSLALTGSAVTLASGILDSYDSIDTYPQSPQTMSDQDEDDGTLYSLFYKKNWAKNFQDAGDKETSPQGSNKRKVPLVPDDQYLLDAGQNSVGIVTCSKCGVMYQAGDFADEAMHRNFHNHLPELRFQGWSNERVIAKFDDGRVISVVNGDPKAWWQKVSKIVEIVDQDLGFPEVSIQALLTKTVYLYISEKARQVVGCLIVEPCKAGFRMFPPLEGVDVISCSRDPEPCEVGVSRMWTALSHRRRGVATRMIDTMCKTFLSDRVLPMDAVAFSSPSPAGMALAQKVTGRQDYLVYGF